MTTIQNDITYQNTGNPYASKEIEQEETQDGKNIQNESGKSDTSEKISKFQLQQFVEDWEDVTYGRKSIDEVDENSQQFMDGLLTSVNHMEPFKSELAPGEIYAFSFYDGKVHVTGGEGYEDKAATYEKLLNASLKCTFQWSWNGRVVPEEQVLNKLHDMLQYYMDIDNEIYKADSKDSIVNHAGEAFAQWSNDNRPKNLHFESRI